MHIAAQAKKVTCKCSAGSEKSSSVKKKRPVYGYFLHYRTEMELCVWSRAFIDTEAVLTFILHTSSYSALKIQSTARSMNTKMYECTWAYPAGWASHRFLLCQNVMPQPVQHILRIKFWFTFCRSFSILFHSMIFLYTNFNRLFICY